METSELQAAGVGQAPTPATSSGDSADAAVSSPTAKLAARVSAVVASFRKSAAATKEPADSTKTTVSTTGNKAQLPSALPADKQIPPFAGEKAAAEDLANELPVDAYVKLASAILDSEEGLAFATALIKQAKGAEAAQALINNAINAQEQFAKSAAAHQAGGNLVEQIFANANDQERALLIKVATAHQEQLAVIAQQASADSLEAEKAAYAQGAMDAGAMEESAAAPVEGMPAEGALPGGEEETSDEDIIAVIQQLVESGQLPPEVAEQLLVELQGEAGAEPMEGELPPETEEEKSAGVKDPVLAITGAHRKSASANAHAAAELIRAALA
jgi:hypothetical protein